MALDVYVMPLWRFKAGDFTSPIEEALGVKPTVVSLAGLQAPRPRIPWHLRILEKLGIVEIEFELAEPEPTPEEWRAVAIHEVEELKRELTRQVGMPIDWPDEGAVVHGKQYHQARTLRTFAAWQDHRDALPEFTAAPEGNYYEHPVWKLPKPTSRRFPTLAEHNLNTGYLIPVPFEGHYLVEPFKIMDHWEFFHSVASSQAILRELGELLELMPAVPNARPGDELTPLQAARWAAQELQRICTLSIEHRLPVTFYG